MRWLLWSTVDLENGLGGVEVHSKCVAQELRKRGIEVKFSGNPKDLQDSSFDVIHTHGSSLLLSDAWYRGLYRLLGKRFYSQEANLNLLTRQEIRKMGMEVCGTSGCLTLRDTKFLALSANLILILRKA